MRTKQTGKSRRGNGLSYLIAIAVLAIGVYVGVFYKLAHETRIVQSRVVPPFYSSAAQAMPLPSTLDPARFPAPQIRKAYATAKAIPAVMAQQPCYCDCDGHRSLLDCFKDEHAAGCSICIRETLYVDEHNTKGQCAEAIRDGIIRGDWKLQP